MQQCVEICMYLFGQSEQTQQKHHSLPAVKTSVTHTDVFHGVQMEEQQDDLPAVKDDLVSRPGLV